MDETLSIIALPPEMVISVGRVNLASYSREYGIAFEIGPPAAVRPGLPFTLPVIVRVWPIGNVDAGGSVQQLVMYSSLWNEAGPAPGLTGTLTSSVRSHTGNNTSGYACFSPLVIAAPGQYRLRVTLAEASAGGVTTRESVDSNVIQVHAGAAPSQRPTPTQILRLQSLIPENIDITAEDIAAWQRA